MDFKAALPVRRRIFRAVALLFFAVIVCNLINLMLVRHEHFRDRALKNRQLQFRVQAPRGRITDRDGIPLADNRFHSDITVPVSSFAGGEADSTLTRLLTWFALPLESTLADLQTQQRRGRGRVSLVRGATMSQLMAVEERRLRLPGARVESRLRRRYLWGPLFAHVIGYTSEVDQEDLDRAGGEFDYRPGDYIGKRGVEAAFESRLRGVAGIKLEEVNASGRIVGRESIWLRPVEPGRDVALTLSLPLQVAMDSLLAGRPGSAVALAIPSGEVLAAVSLPSFDANLMTAAISVERWRQLSEDPAKPFFNRIVQATYAPGSLYKAITSLAALRKGVIDTTSTLEPCLGGMQFGNRYARCWKPEGHGRLDHAAALAHSCGVYYYQLGLRLEIDELAEAARAFGLGDVVTDIFPDEAAGNIPTAAWYDRRFGRGQWTRGVLLNNAIGQGEILVTPLQMALLAARLAVDGQVPGPVFVRGQTPAVGSVELPFHPRHMQWIRRALRQVVDAGTGRAARQAGVAVAGKTGTAENVHGQNHAWFMCYAPASAPEVAVVVMLENAGGGGAEAAPVAGAWLRQYFAHNGVAGEPASGRRLP
ncbi:MAG: penicillin-binding protein 2 [Candidatus Krumholzibacteria bacterium]|jgi:penicillin-binding protein 2|nr:penicillin-binding protein 2 [Candidatus Krumholzibacteria bacterium]